MFLFVSWQLVNHWKRAYEVAHDAGPRFVAIYFPAEELDELIRHLRAMGDEYEAQG